MLNCVSGRYTPTMGSVSFKGQDVTGLKPNDRAELGIGRTFQNLALFGHMNVLDNIMVGRHHLLKNNFVNGPLYWLGGAQKEELEHRRFCEDVIDFLEISTSARQQPERFHMVCASGLSLRVRLRCAPI